MKEDKLINLRKLDEEVEALTNHFKKRKIKTAGDIELIMETLKGFLNFRTTKMMLMKEE